MRNIGRIQVTNSGVQEQNAAKDPHVAILMAVYNGAETLSEQLASLTTQEHSNWSLLAGDDHSTDQSREILDDFAAQGHALHHVQGPGKGSAANFLNLIVEASERAPAGSWLAFCDQDDVWLPERLSRGIAALETLPDDTPALYCSRTWITEFDLSGRKLSPPRPRPPGFRNALVQNIAAGNTILLNAAGARLAMAAAREVEALVLHDWWLYQLITGVGGTLVHDDRPSLLYRQHPRNQIGANDSAHARLKRIQALLRGDYRDWNTVNIAALTASRHRLTPEHQEILDRFAMLRSASLRPRLAALTRLGVYRQTKLGNAALWVAASLGRL